MISLKKYIDSNRDELLNSALASYRAALEAMGTSGSQVCPPLGSSLQDSLRNLQKNLSAEVTPTLVEKTEQQVESELRQWGANVSDYLKVKTGEFKEMLIVMAHTVEAVGERDQRYAAQMQEFTTRLESIADLNGITEIRESIIQGAGELRACACKMVEESKQAVLQLKAQVDSYEKRLDDAEKLAGIDPLTGLNNRRTVESAIDRRLAERAIFSILLLDLNEFKNVNDLYGHVAGDDLLAQFAGELKAAFRAIDVVGRWGGDEFIVVLDGTLDDAVRYVDRVRKWVFGNYSLKCQSENTGESEPRKYEVTASIGAAAWKPGDTKTTLLDRADKAMYHEKAACLKSNSMKPALAASRVR